VRVASFHLGHGSVEGPLPAIRCPCPEPVQERLHAFHRYHLPIISSVGHQEVIIIRSPMFEGE
jgi:hypothetical protein